MISISQILSFKATFAPLALSGAICRDLVPFNILDDWVPVLDNLERRQQSDDCKSNLGQRELLAWKMSWSAAKGNETPERWPQRLPSLGTECISIISVKIFSSM